MTEYEYELKIPEDRVPILIGKNGKVKKELEELSHCEIDVDSKEGDIFLIGEDSLALFTMREIIQAIGRGFNPEIAKLLLKPDYVFELINMNDFIKTKNDLIRLRGRVIGTDGKTRSLIEELAETHISVYGKTVGIIGEAENVPVAKRAIESLLRGSPHSNVYKWLEKQRRDLKRRKRMEF